MITNALSNRRGGMMIISIVLLALISSATLALGNLCSTISQQTLSQKVDFFLTQEADAEFALLLARLTTSGSPSTATSKLQSGSRLGYQTFYRDAGESSCSLSNESLVKLDYPGGDIAEPPRSCTFKSNKGNTLGTITYTNSLSGTNTLATANVKVCFKPTGKTATCKTLSADIESIPDVAASGGTVKIKKNTKKVVSSVE